MLNRSTRRSVPPVQDEDFDGQPVYPWQTAPFWSRVLVLHGSSTSPKSRGPNEARPDLPRSAYSPPTHSHGFGDFLGCTIKIRDRTHDPRVEKVPSVSACAGYLILEGAERLSGEPVLSVRSLASCAGQSFLRRIASHDRSSSIERRVDPPRFEPPVPPLYS